MARYDIDRFSQLVASEGFSNIYALPDGEMRNILCDDEALMQSGVRVLRQVLFGEESIPLRKEAAEERRLRVIERKQCQESEAAAQRAMEQEEMYEKPERE